MVVVAEPVTTERIGKFEFSVACEPEPQDRSEERISALAAWLLAEWQREQQARRQHGTASSDN